MSMRNILSQSYQIIAFFILYLVQKIKLLKEIINFINVIKDIEELNPEAYELSIIAFLHMIFQNIYQKN